MTVAMGEPQPPSTSDWGPGVSLTGPVDRDLSERATSHLDAVNGAMIGLLLRASRRLAWRNRQLTIVCRDSEFSRRLRMAGIDELATLVESA